MIEVKNLEKTYYNEDVETPALRGVSFNIKKGEFVAIMGPSGSGKSTLLHVLGFLDRHTKGIYKLDGKSMDDYTKDEIARLRNEKMGFIFQQFNLLPRTTVLDNVMLPLLYSNVSKFDRKKIVLEAIESVGLSHRIYHESSQLSGGEKQRVAIARALVNNPEIIFADEPTGNLDSKSGQAIMEIIEDLNEKKGHTIILITHETYTAEYSQRIIRFLDGVIESDEKVNRRHRAHDGFRK
ncbi:MAG: macrolide ABC transporter ATP-binding protein [Candidatus Yanofskybacteria bacterium CG10_big_fil_rev_8_21_14_0_10_36_16]|uniref:Macrolide ABC transporter ATP-binding protein n=1 Tax=Candidatus Yanofskybacteria bacterium CG10_big_fil_rev_8_21_14_0_10_36_16 TaxID=1975096 RepID=A0A2J0QAT7_9BACT|nr:MAG: macrolide ABC transporter ATP-binding protein [Candidatus Yanofskybacteria bacterium CG10_big_fil_rev_8_21_14_0_10_36_16]